MEPELSLDAAYAIELERLRFLARDFSTVGIAEWKTQAHIVNQLKIRIDRRDNPPKRGRQAARRVNGR